MSRFHETCQFGSRDQRNILVRAPATHYHDFLVIGNPIQNGSKSGTQISVCCLDGHGV